MNKKTKDLILKLGEIKGNYKDYFKYVKGAFMKIDKLLIDFDEMGFAPTTLCENPDEYAREWKGQLVAEIKKFKIQLDKQEWKNEQARTD